MEKRLRGETDGDDEIGLKDIKKFRKEMRKQAKIKKQEIRAKKLASGEIQPQKVLTPEERRDKMKIRIAKMKERKAAKTEIISEIDSSPQ